MLALLTAAALAALAAGGPTAGDRSVYMDPAQPIEARVAALLAQMTTLEKQAQTVHLTGHLNGSAAATLRVYGATGLGALPGGFSTPEAQAAQNAFQRDMLNASRLGIPVTFHVESLHSGVSGGTVFPMPCAQGASWNAPLVRGIARAIAAEAAAGGIDRGFSPELNVVTDPRFGRLEENFGEDPNLVAAMGDAAVVGLHGGECGGPSTYLPRGGGVGVANWSAGAIVSEAKHAAAYGFGGKDGAPADLSPRALHDGTSLTRHNEHLHTCGGAATVR